MFRTWIIFRVHARPRKAAASDNRLRELNRNSQTMCFRCRLQIIIWFYRVSILIDFGRVIDDNISTAFCQPTCSLMNNDVDADILIRFTESIQIQRYV